jgi:hypothetical protein
MLITNYDKSLLLYNRIVYIEAKYLSKIFLYRCLKQFQHYVIILDL